MLVYSDLLVLAEKKDACSDAGTSIRSIFRAFHQLTLKWNPRHSITSLTELKVQVAVTYVPNDQLSISPLSSWNDLRYVSYLIASNADCSQWAWPSSVRQSVKLSPVPPLHSPQHSKIQERQLSLESAAVSLPQHTYYHIHNWTYFFHSGPASVCMLGLDISVFRHPEERSRTQPGESIQHQTWMLGMGPGCRCAWPGMAVAEQETGAPSTV